MGSYRPGRVSVAAAAGGMACVVAVLAGCSSSSSKTTTSTAAGSLSSSSSSTAAASPSASPASAAQLAKIVLQPTDFPTGWDHTPYKPDPSDSAAYAEFAKCLGAPNTDQVAGAFRRLRPGRCQDFLRGVQLPVPEYGRCLHRRAAQREGIAVFRAAGEADARQRGAPWKHDRVCLV